MSGRPYKVILERLHTVHGFKKRLACYSLPELNSYKTIYSMSWFKKLGLKKRCTDPPEEDIKAILQVCNYGAR